MYRKYTVPEFRPGRGEMERVLLERISPITRTETIAFYETAGRVCAVDVFSRNTLPNRPVSRFDGIGVRFGDFEGGVPDTAGWKQGQEYVFCNTGIAIPDGFDTVIPIEEVDVEEGALTLHTPPAKRGENVGAAGGQMREGELLARQEQVIAPADVGLFASGGVEQVEVLARPRVRVIPTGDELVPPTAQVPAGKNVDSNSYMISAYLSGLGALPERHPIVPDRPEALTCAVKEGLENADFVIIIAGSSLGTEDYTLDVMGKLGEIVVPEMAYGPGRKTSFTMVGEKPVLGIPGPPMGAQITCDTYLSLILSALQGLPPVRLQTLEVISDDDFAPHEVDFCERVHIYRGDDGYHIRSLLRHRTTRAQMQLLTNGNFYRPAETRCVSGGRTTVELLCPIEYIPEKDQLLVVVPDAK